MVDVTGEVRRPGVQSWPAGARVWDAVRKAGGPTASGDVQPLNLAARLSDGQQIKVSRRGAHFSAVNDELPGVVRQGSSDAKTSSSRTSRPEGRGKVNFVGSINVNSASASELESLPGIGPAIAARIIAARAQQGRLRSLEDLDKVKGLGPKKLEVLRPHVVF